MLSKVGKYSFLTAPFHCDFSNQLFIGHLGNHLLNASDFHSNERGFGMHYLNTIHKTWVLSRLSIEILEMPKAYTSFFVETWVEGVMKFFTNRSYQVVDEKNDKILAYGRSIWAMIDTDSRQPTDLLSVNDGNIVTYIEERDCPIAPFARVRLNTDAPLLKTIKTNYSDVDPNGHINSIKYIEHLLDIWDLEWYKTYNIERLDIAYVAESHFGDILHYFVERKSTTEYIVCIKKENTYKEEHTEVCRLKISFRKNKSF